MYFGCSVLPLNGTTIQMNKAAPHTQGYTPAILEQQISVTVAAAVRVTAIQILFAFQATPTILPSPYRHFTIIISVILQQNNSFFRLLRCVVFQHICTLLGLEMEGKNETTEPNRNNDEKAGKSRKFNIISQ